MNHAIKSGFIKRAEEHGLSEDQAELLFKRADNLQELAQNMYDNAKNSLYTGVSSGGLSSIIGAVPFSTAGAAAGTLAGGLGGSYLTSDPEKKTRNALIGATLLGGLGAGGGSLLGGSAGLSVAMDNANNTLLDIGKNIMAKHPSVKLNM